jgi:hypothetical protein
LDAASNDVMTIMYDPERLVVEELLGRPRGRERARIYATHPRLPAEAIDGAIDSLERAGLLRATGQRVWPTEALLRLEGLSLIAL